MTHTNMTTDRALSRLSRAGIKLDASNTPHIPPIGTGLGNWSAIDSLIRANIIRTYTKTTKTPKTTKNRKNRKNRPIFTLPTKRLNPINPYNRIINHILSSNNQQKIASLIQVLSSYDIQINSYYKKGSIA